MAEASVRRRLQEHNVTVNPNEDLDTGQKAPDFRCENSGDMFYVEVACISIKTATKVTGIPKDAPFNGNFNPINLAVFNKCVAKVRQVSSVEFPVLIAIGTWHGFVAMQFRQHAIVNMLLTGDSMNITWDIDLETGEQSNVYSTTNLYPALFSKLDEENKPTPLRGPISGVILCAFGMPRTQPIVILNPNAHRSFIPALLPRLEYGSLMVNSEEQTLEVQWKTYSESDSDENEENGF